MLGLKCATWTSIYVPFVFGSSRKTRLVDLDTIYSKVVNLNKINCPCGTAKKNNVISYIFLYPSLLFNPFLPFNPKTIAELQNQINCQN